jgi:hypothetical protein
MILAPFIAYTGVVLWAIFLLMPGLVHADLICDGTDDRIVTANITGAPTTYPYAITAIVRFAVLAVAEYEVFQAGLISPANGYEAVVRGDMMLLRNNATGAAPFQGGLTLPVNKTLYLAWTSGSATSHRFYAWNYDDRTTITNSAVATNMQAITTPTSSLKMCAREGPVGAFAGVYLNGTVRQVAIYNKDWTASADPFRAMAYLGPYAVSTPTLLYNFQSTTGTTVREQQGTGNVGTMTNFPASPWVPMTFPRPFWLQ